MGLGDRRGRTNRGAAASLRFGDRAQRPYPPDCAKGGRQHHLPYRAIHRLPAAWGRHWPWSRSAARGGSGIAGHAGRHYLYGARKSTFAHRFNARLKDQTMKTTLLAAALVMGCFQVAAAADATVEIKDFMFAMDVTVAPGSTVTWKNED